MKQGGQIWPVKYLPFASLETQDLCRKSVATACSCQPLWGLCVCWIVQCTKMQLFKVSPLYIWLTSHWIIFLVLFYAYVVMGAVLLVIVKLLTKVSFCIVWDGLIPSALSTLQYCFLWEVEAHCYVSMEEYGLPTIVYVCLSITSMWCQLLQFSHFLCFIC